MDKGCRITRKARRAERNKKGLSYEERLNRLKLFSLEKGHLRKHTIEGCKILNGAKKVSRALLFAFSQMSEVGDVK